jgi:hypothetical protein
MAADRIAAVLAALVLLTGCGGGEPSTTWAGASPSARSTSPERHVITAADHGRTITVSMSAAVIVRLSTGDGAAWSDLHATGPSEVVPVSYRTDPGYREWEIRLTGHGTVILESSCSGPGCERSQFRVSLHA